MLIRHKLFHSTGSKSVSARYKPCALSLIDILHSQLSIKMPVMYMCQRVTHILSTRMDVHTCHVPINNSKPTQTFKWYGSKRVLLLQLTPRLTFRFYRPRYCRVSCSLLWNIHQATGLNPVCIIAV